MQQKYNFTTYNKNNKARCKKDFLFVKMTIPICVNRKFLRMKPTAKQENTRNFKKNSYIPKKMFRPWRRGSATVPKIFALPPVWPPSFILNFPLSSFG